MPTLTYSSNPALHDELRRARAQELVAVGLAAVVLVATAVTATSSVVDRTSLSASRAEEVVDLAPALSVPDDQCHDSVCPFGTP